MTLMQRLAAKQKADAARAEQMAAKRYAARIARKVARVTERSTTDGLDALPLDVALAIEESAPQLPLAQPVPLQRDESSIDDLVQRLTLVREHIWRLQAMFAVSLSHDCAMDANRYLTLFQDIAQKLREKDPGALEEITRGHESLLLSPPIAVKQSVPLSTQNLVELRWLAMTKPTQRPSKRPADEIHDGLSCLFN
jgi:hypothetical protein